MSSTSIKDKTVRPGSFKGLYYYSDRHKAQVTPSKAEDKPKHAPPKIILLVILVAVIGGWYFGVHKGSADKDSNTVASQTSGNKAVAAPPTNHCAANSLPHFIRISVEKRHLWACNGASTAYDSKVITGLRNDAETETPVGTYKIYAKQTNTTLTGSDSRGTWKDPVYYWMPFLTNRYGTYGFHDATWRDDNAFGNISPDSTDASHGCVELPLQTSKWLYNWAPIGTTVTVEA
jgi:hypothetical protein